MKRYFALSVAALFLLGEFAWHMPGVLGEPTASSDDPPVLDLFDAMQQDLVDAKFIARDAHRGRIVLTNKTKDPLNVAIPDAFIGVPQVQAQFGGGGGGFGGGGGGLGGGGGQQSVGGGGGGRGGGG
ncbi:MAG TPA: hypothetical protein VEQ85_00010, partial [Lacipirellulaceae bacterium]|nr:hypothetical protein [Lacipirellulaceae bacterium]